MSEIMEKNVREILENELKKMADKTFKVRFFVVDTKGAPSGMLTYVYDLAYQMKELGYDVQMIYSDADFVGVGSWLGDKYAELPHINAGKDSKDFINASLADVLFVPEVCISVLSQLKNSIPSKKVVICQNFSYLTESMPVGVTFDDLNVRDCVAISESVANDIKEFFPSVNTCVVRPSIPDFFNNEDTEKKPIINVVSKNNTETQMIVNTLFWKYPNYKWVPLRPLRNVPRQVFAEKLKESVATIWIDDYTDFGYSALEAMACGNIVIGKCPQSIPEWMVGQDGKFLNNGAWFFETKKYAPSIIADVVESFLTDSIPEEVLREAAKTAENYREEAQKADIVANIVNGLFEQRRKELEFLLSVENNNENTEKEQ